MMKKVLPIIYGVVQRFFVPEKHHQLKKIISGINLPVPSRVLDVGCGTGQAVPLFSDQNRYAYLGVEVSEDCLVSAKERFPDVSFRLFNMVEKSLDEPLFDIVLIDSVFHHLTDEFAFKLLQHVSTQLKPEGVLLLQDMVFPQKRWGMAMIQRMLIALDRGKYCREKENLIKLVGEEFNITQEVTYKIISYDMCLLRCQPLMNNMS